MTRAALFSVVVLFAAGCGSDNGQDAGTTTRTTTGSARDAERALETELRKGGAGGIVDLERPEPITASAPNTPNVDVASLSEMAVSELIDTAESGDGDPALGRGAHRTSDEGTGRLRDQLNQPVTVAFDDELADDVQDALRRQASFEGEIAYDPETMSARTVRVRRVTRGRQLTMLPDFDADAFWPEPSFAQLLAEKRGAVATDPDAIYNPEATNEERETFIAATRAWLSESRRRAARTPGARHRPLFVPSPTERATCRVRSARFWP